MKSSVNRRGFLTAASLLGLSGAVPAFGVVKESAADDVAETFPRQDPEQVRDTVLYAHTDLDRVKELVEARPALAKASMDWGFGDWESALGAASHMGGADIAEYLLAKGARPNIFSAAMLGQLSVVRAFVESSPGVQRIRGPHSITLLAHAKAGGDRAKEVVAYLEKLGDAGSAGGEPLTSEQMQTYTGKYGYGAAGNRQLEVLEGRFGIMLITTGKFGPNLRYLGDHTFHPTGAESVRIHFAVEEGKALKLTVHDGSLVVTATRL